MPHQTQTGPPRWQDRTPQLLVGEPLQLTEHVASGSGQLTDEHCAF